MAKIQDKLYNRVIEGELLEITEEEKSKLGLGGGTKLYKHSISVTVDNKSTTISVVSTRSTNYDLSNLEKDARAAKIFGLYGSVYTSNVMKTFIGFVVGSTGSPVIASIKMDDNTIVLYQVGAVTYDSVTAL